MRTELGKITSIKLGRGGYQDCMFGVSFGLGGPGWGVGDFLGDWDTDSKPEPGHTQWTEADRNENFAKVMRHISKLCLDAKVQSMNQLVGVPVEIEWSEDRTLVSWRILTEVV